MSELGAISSYVLAVQNMQMSLIKQSAMAQQQMLSTLFDQDQSRTVPTSNIIGTHTDISI